MIVDVGVIPSQIIIIINNTFIYIAPYPAGCSWRLTTQYIIVINMKVNYF